MINFLLHLCKAGPKASVLFLQKLNEEKLNKLKKENYPIFMAVVEKIGYDLNSKTPKVMFKKDEKGEIIKDENGERKRTFSVKKLGEIAKISKGVEVGSDAYVDDGKLFLRVSNITEKEIVISDSAEFIRENLFNELKTKYKPMPGEVIYTKDATVGIAFPVDNDFNDVIISGRIIRIKPHKDLDPYYLSLVLNSVLCRSQAERHSIGAVIKHYTYSKIKDLLIPIASEQTQKQISELVKQSFLLRKESKELIEKAKKS